MSVNITFLGHSGFLIKSGEHAVCLDAFLTGNPVAKHTPDDIACTAVAVTHGHADHYGPDTLAIAKRNNATFYGPYEIADHMGELGYENCEPVNPGGRLDTDFGWIAFTSAQHSSSFNGRYMGCACGVVVHIGGVTLYHLGDTDLFNDLRLYGETYNPDIAFIPAGDRFTMGPELARHAAEMIKPRIAVPIHWGTFPLLAQDVTKFCPSGVEVKTMSPGETWTYER